MVFSDNQLITLSSRDAVKNNGTYLSDVVFNFKGILKDENNIVRCFVRVLNAQIPVSFYTIDATNNVLAYKITSSTFNRNTPARVRAHDYWYNTAACVARACPRRSSARRHTTKRKSRRLWRSQRHSRVQRHSSPLCGSAARRGHLPDRPLGGRPTK